MLCNLKLFGKMKSGVDSAGFHVFISGPDPDPESQISEKPVPESFFNFGSSGSLHGHFKNMGKLRLDR